MNQLQFPEPGIIVLDGGDELFFNEYVIDFYHHVLHSWRSSNKPIALYFGCSHHKPFSKSFVHMKVIRMLKKHDLYDVVQQFIISEPLAICPRELELEFPAANYNFPPERLGRKGREEFIKRLKIFLQQRALKDYEHHVTFMPNHHKEIFYEAAGNMLKPLNIPYNVYHLPKLLQVLKELKQKNRG